MGGRPNISLMLNCPAGPSRRAVLERVRMAMAAGQHCPRPSGGRSQTGGSRHAHKD